MSRTGMLTNPSTKQRMIENCRVSLRGPSTEEAPKQHARV
ncbi:hypothetical protein RISK_006129 [Rhodopirellula islandica]|uniref:Uncharacterized protein n=1 Tax=Rhodopirellula islandica TaxID=595434 RepID=A0A0J1B559_RHOIS|nr:hypothetical protein RISK_006129 [Rhodopirellula islandica]